MRHPLVLAAAAILFLISCFTAAIVSARPIVIGSINSDPQEEIRLYTPIARYLGEQLRDYGISDGKAVIARSMGHMVELMLKGKVDLYIDSPFPALQVGSQCNGIPFLRRWKGGVSEYTSVIFTHKDSTINSLNDLQGKLIGFEEPCSSSAFFLPKLTLLQEEFVVTEKKDFYSAIEADEIGYVFSGSDKNTMYWVLHNRIEAGAMSLKNAKKLAGKDFAQLKIIHRSFPVPRHVVIHRFGLHPELVTKIREVLINLDQTQSGRVLLKEFESTEKFDSIPPESLNKMKAGIEYMKQQQTEPVDN